MCNELNVQVIVGPTGCGKTAMAERLARRSGVPIVVVDRIQCFTDLEVTSARTPRGQEQGIRRIYPCDRMVADGDFSPQAAFRSLLYRIGVLAAKDPAALLEGGSISMLTLLAGSEDLPFRLSVDVMRMGERCVYLQRLRDRARMMLRPALGGPGMLEELARAWKYEDQRPFLATINGFEAILAWCQAHGEDPILLADRERTDPFIGELEEAVALVHRQHGEEQEVAFLKLFGAPMTRSTRRGRRDPAGQRVLCQHHPEHVMPSAPAVTVFCGSSTGNLPAYRNAALELGRLLADEGIELVYGGASIGLMGALADAVLERGGIVSGVIPQSILDYEIGHSSLNYLHVVETMHERKALMAQLGDAFVALPGGLGTVEEFLEILTWAQLGIHRKPCLILDVAQFYAPLLTMLRHFVIEGFISPDDLDSVHICAAPADAVAYLRKVLRPRHLAEAT